MMLWKPSRLVAALDPPQRAALVPDPARHRHRRRRRHRHGHHRQRHHREGQGRHLQARQQPAGRALRPPAAPAGRRARQAAPLRREGRWRRSARSLTGVRAVAPAVAKAGRASSSARESLTTGVTGTDQRLFRSRTTGSWRPAASFSDARDPRRHRRLPDRRDRARAALRRRRPGGRRSSASTASPARSSACSSPRASPASARTRTTPSSCRCTPIQRRIAGNRDIDTIYIAARRRRRRPARCSRDSRTSCASARRIAPEREDDFTIRDMTQIADAMASTTTSMTGCWARSPASACWSAASAS